MGLAVDKIALKEQDLPRRIQICNAKLGIFSDTSLDIEEEKRRRRNPQSGGRLTEEHRGYRKRQKVIGVFEIVYIIWR